MLFAAPIPVDIGQAKRYFDEARAACEADGGHLWGISLCGPLMLVERQSRLIVANQPDAKGVLRQQDGAYVGALPGSEPIANTAITWSGTRWTQVEWPLPLDPARRLSLLMHESFHRVQDQLGPRNAEQPNTHLDSVEGRVLLQLEWRALAQALAASGGDQKQRISDALLFRTRRRELFTTAAAQEGALERNEGLAEYTGVKLAGDSVSLAAKNLESAAGKPSFVRSFAYGSGPAYGLLLDASGSAWRKRAAAGEDLGALLRESRSIALPDDLAGIAAERAASYDGAGLRASEQAREENRQRRIAEFRSRLVDGPTLSIPLQKMQVQFNPNELLPLDGFGTIYPTLRVSDVWGTLTVSRGALLDPGWKQVQVAAPGSPSGRPLEGDGWALELQPGWELGPGRRQGSYLLRKMRD